MAKKSDAVIVSSHDALKDLRSFVPQYAHKARVLNFVAQPNPLVFTTDRAIAEKKFGIDRKYFYLPNQFWKHKNHIVVFEAIKLLKMKEPAVLLVCSGSMSDYRNIDHMQFLVDFVRSNDLEDNIKLLGMIDQIDLFSLMRNSISVINPSLFEGWSTTVEECKSLGKNMILSDIPVHREQNPPGAKYFSPRDPHELEHLLYHEYRNSSGGPDLTLETLAASCLKKRCREYAETYQGIVLDVLQ